MSTVKEDFEKATSKQSQALMEKFQKVVDETTKAIEDEINTNLVSRQRTLEAAVKKLEA